MMLFQYHTTASSMSPSVAGHAGCGVGARVSAMGAPAAPLLLPKNSGFGQKSNSKEKGKKGCVD